MTFEQAAIEVMRERGETYIWFGNLSLWEDVYQRRYGGGNAVRTRNPHPMNRAQAVFDALRRSKKFKRTGYIRSIAWSNRETLHPVYTVQP